MCSGLVPLHNACSYGHYEVTQLLIEVFTFLSNAFIANVCIHVHKLISMSQRKLIGLCLSKLKISRQDSCYTVHVNILLICVPFVHLDLLIPEVFP